MEVFPSSVRLKHALARFYLYNKNAQLSDPIYKELYEMPSLPDEGIKHEVQNFYNSIRRSKRKDKKRKIK